MMSYWIRASFVLGVFAAGVVLVSLGMTPAQEPGTSEVAREVAAKEPANKTDSDAVEVQGTVDEVTVYRNQALITRNVNVPGPKGLQELVVVNLPESVIPESIFAESADGVEVRSVRYRIRPVEEDVRDEVRQLDQQMQEVQNQVQANHRYQQLLAEHKQYLAKLEQFTAPTANIELTQGVLNAETLKALTSFLLEQRENVAKEELALGDQLVELNDQLSVLQRRREVLAGGSAKTIREAVVFVNVTDAGGQLRIRYLVNNASWSPSYNLRTSGDREKVTVEYQASIQQMSGEDWTNVKMSLSTATPSLAAKAPDLEPLVINLTSQPSEQSQQAAGQVINDFESYRDARQKLLEQQRQIEFSRQKGGAKKDLELAAPNAQAGALPGGPPAGEVDYDYHLNYLANEAQVLDLVTQGELNQGGKLGASSSTEGVSVNYELAARTSLPSRADRQLIQIAALPLEAESYKIAIPVLTSYVYDEARVVNDSQYVLLPGPFTTYVDGQFVGRGELPLVAVGETFVAGFGIDSSLRAGRELVEKADTIQGGNRVVDISYQLTLQNFGTEPAEVRLVDRLPTTKDSGIQVELVSTEQELSDDPRYQDAERKKGLLRWEVTVPAQAIGPKAFTLDYELQLEYDKQLSIAGLPLSR